MLCELSKVGKGRAGPPERHRIEPLPVHLLLSIKGTLKNIALNLAYLCILDSLVIVNQLDLDLLSCCV